MARTCHLAIFSFLFLCLFFAETGFSGSPPVRKEILLVNSYHQNFPWTSAVDEAINEVLRPQDAGMVLHVENMDTKRVVYDEAYINRLKNIFTHKYRHRNLDLILTTDNNAFDFIKRTSKELFPGVPVVFGGVNGFRPDQLSGFQAITGVAETLAAKGTLDLALKLHPDTSVVLVITDHTPTGRAAASEIRSQLTGYDGVLTIRYTPESNIDELIAAVSRLQKNALILFGVYNRDADGRFFNTGEVTQLLNKTASVPMYGLWRQDVGTGVLGGHVISARHQGQTMAQIALHVLSGRLPEDIPVSMATLSEPVFDFNQLRRFGLALADLPPDSIIINRPRSFYQENRSLIWTVCLFLFVQTVIIIVLVGSTSKRKLAEARLRKAHQDLEDRVKVRTSELRESEQALRTVFDSANDAIFLHTPAGKILDVNDRMLQMYGVSRVDAMQMSISRDFSSRDNPTYKLSSLWRNAINGEPQHFEWRARRPHNDTEFDVEIHLVRITYRKELAILANVRDISVRKESENRIRQSLSKFEAILENSLMGIAMTRGRRFVTINRRGAQVFGYEPNDFIGRELSRLLFSPEEEELFIATSRQALTRSGEFNTEQKFKGRNGNLVWCRMYAKAVDPNSLDKGIIWAWDDITEQKKTQQAIVDAREEAVAANRAKSEFLAAMSHEIRTPMNAIVGMTDITLQTDLSDEQKDYLHTVKDSAQHLLDIINDILDLSKIEARKLELDRVDFDLPFHIRTTIKGLEVQARQKDLRMELDIKPDVPQCINGDPVCLRQILVNLVGNAVKFTHSGYVKVVVSKGPTPPVQDTDTRTQSVRFEIIDTGIGIPKEFMGSIFQSFSQSTRAFGGTGLGLAICKQLITLMGGKISVQSEVGTGSTFAFTARFEPGISCPVPRGEPTLPGAQDRPIRVLVAEDNDVNIMVTTLRLEDMGYNYSVAKTGLEVIDLLKREPFDIILMDIEMPVLDGISATKTIRSSPPDGPIPCPDIPIVAMTAHALKEFRDKSLKAGMNAYVSKPVDFHELNGIINRLVGAVQPATPKPEPAAPESPAPRAETQDRPVEIEKSPTEVVPVFAEGLDKEVLHGFVETAKYELKRHLETLLAHLDDRELARESAHAMASICATIAVFPARRAADRVERALRTGALTPDSEELRLLSDEIHTFLDSLKTS